MERITLDAQPTVEVGETVGDGGGDNPVKVTSEEPHPIICKVGRIVDLTSQKRSEPAASRPRVRLGLSGLSVVVQGQL